MNHTPHLKTFKLTDDLVDKCRAYFEADPKIRALNLRIEKLKKTGGLAELMQCMKQKEDLFTQVLVAYEEQLAGQVEEIKLSAANVPADDLRTIKDLIVTLFMAVDIMDSCLMDINSTLHKTDAAFSFDKLDDLHEMAQICRYQLSQFANTQRFHQYAFWGDITDDMFAMMRSKAKSIIRKTEEAEKNK